MTAPQHLAHMFFSLTFLWVCYSVGILLMLIYLRLSKLWIVIFSIGLGLFVLGLLPLLAMRFWFIVAPFLQWLVADLGNWMLIMLPLTVALAAGSYLVFRRAPIKGTK